MKTVRAWHFVGDTLRDGRPVPADGVWLKHTGAVIPCESGLHASVDPFDALQYASGSVLCEVVLRGKIVEHDGDKISASDRMITRRMDFADPLRYFARMQAVSVLHLWHVCPPDVVLDYLMTGDESLRDAARDAARDATGDVTGDAAWGAARDAARDAAWFAAWNAAWVDAAWVGSAWNPAWNAARDAAWDAAWNAARDAARADFNKLVNECFQ